MAKPIGFATYAQELQNDFFLGWCCCLWNFCSSGLWIFGGEIMKHTKMLPFTTICKNCGKRLGKHRMLDNACPNYSLKGGNYLENQKFERESK
jgi:hypothetical protein